MVVKHCLICEREIEVDDLGYGWSPQNMDAVMFRAWGGTSSAYDQLVGDPPMAVLICDDCFRRKRSLYGNEWVRHEPREGVRWP